MFLHLPVSRLLRVSKGFAQHENGCGGLDSAAILVLALFLLPREFRGSHPTPMDKYLFLGLALVPASLAALL